MSRNRPQDGIDEVIHQRSRLSIMASLASVDSRDFNELKAELALTDGNLSTHATALERAGYVKIRKRFRGKKPRTTLSMTPRGRKALTDYVEALQSILDKAK